MKKRKENWKKKMKKAYFPLLLLTLTACTAKAPTQFVQDQAKPSIHPDYTDITIPSNIAPINFCIDDEAEKYVTVMKCGDSEFTTKGRTAAVPLRRWRRLLASGDRVDVTVYAYRNGGWKQFTPFTMNVAEPIDPYISYRLIPPGYQCFEQLTINQRDLTSFRTKVIFCNSTIQYDDKHGSCINCHHYRNYKTDKISFHPPSRIDNNRMFCCIKTTGGNLNISAKGTLPAYDSQRAFCIVARNITTNTISAITGIWTRICLC